jgi:hypothetical protein
MWSWDGSTWTELTATIPDLFYLYTRSAFDSARGVIVLTGLRNTTFETWEWNGTTWTQRLDVGSPTAVFGHALAFDTTREVLVMYGGRLENQVVLPQQTWEYDGVTWIRRTVPPPGDAGAQLTAAFDRTRGRVVMFGGYNTSFQASSRVWEWDGVAWTEPALLPGTSPQARLDAPLVFTRSAIMMFGGTTSGASSSCAADTWSWNGTAWTESPQVQLAPPRRAVGSAVFDPIRGQMLMFGGANTAYLGDLWSWKDRAWTQLVWVGNGPSGRISHASAFDVRRDRLVLFGGRPGTSVRSDETWEWDGNAWSLSMPVPRPSGRWNPTMAYDAARGYVLLFGGIEAAATGGRVTDDTWRWDGAAWMKLAPATVPPARHDAMMAYDAVRDRIVMFGGRDFAKPHDDTWEWDGVDWRARAVSMAPSPRSSAAMTYDPQRRRIVLFGGSTQTVTVGDTWELGETSWLPVPTAIAPPLRASAQSAYDAVDRRFVVFGGSGLSGERGDTWSLSYAAPLEDVERCAVATEDNDRDGLAGCADPDCWGRCAPLCAPGVSCATSAPRCGDGVCSLVEDELLCPADC